nr:hypothetical protein [Tanacetum cinerariifolium]
MWPEGTGPTLSGNVADAPQLVEGITHVHILFLWLSGANGFGCKLTLLCYFLVIYAFDFVPEAYVSWTLALGLIRSALRSGKCTLLGHWHLDSSEASCVPGNVRHLAFCAWTYPERLVLREMYVTWPLALGLIQSVLRSGNVRYLAIDTWTHPECLALWEMYVTWPLALGLI